jgi:hypothetical protein
VVCDGTERVYTLRGRSASTVLLLFELLIEEWQCIGGALRWRSRRSL